MKTKFNRKMIYLILALICSFAVGAAVVGAVWGATSISGRDNFERQNYTCQLYNDHSNAIISDNRENSADLLRQIDDSSWSDAIKSNLARNLSTSDRDFVSACQLQIMYEASQESQNEFTKFTTRDLPFSNFHQLQDEINSVNPQAKWDFDRLFDVSAFAQTERDNYEQAILALFNTLVKLLGIQNFSHVLWSIEPASGFDQQQTVAVTVASFVHYLQCMVYGPLFDNLYTINANYRIGFWSTDNLISVMTHEFGHALSNFLYMAPQERLLLNSDVSSYPQSCTALLDQMQQASSVSREKSEQSNLGIYVFKENPNDYLVDYLAAEAKIDVHDQQWKKLLAFSLVRSGYGRSGGPAELFAESFSQWFLTPELQRGLNWEMLNKFFMHDIYTKYQLKVV